MSEITVTVVGSTHPTALVTGSSTVNVTFADQGSGMGNPAAATLQVGNVATVSATESASVVNVGTAYAAKLDFAIPRGAVTGLAIGTVTQGTAAAASISGVAPSQVLNLTVPANSLSLGGVSTGTAAAASISGAAPSQVLSLTLPANSLSIGAVSGGTQAAASISGAAPSQTLSLVLPIGATGPANSLSIGSVTSGTQAAASISGAAPSQVLSLTLPQGPPNSLSIGSVTSGTQAAASISGAAPSQTLSLVLPTGPQGAQGPAGPANSLTLGTVTTTVGTAAAVTITGTAPSQVISFVVPVSPPNSLSIGAVTSGTQAAAVISGAAPSQTLSLVLPTGPRGLQGPAGSFFDPQPISTKTASYTLSAADAGSLIAFGGGTSPMTVTVPNTAVSSWLVGTHIDIARTGAAAVSVVAGSGVTVGATPGLSLRAQYSAGTLVCISPNLWLLVGDLA